MLYPVSEIPNLTCVYSLSHTEFVYACFKPDLGWCHMQLLHGWQTVSAPQHGALWSACQADRQVNDTNENQPSLPLGARHWVTASKQPKSVSEPESNPFNSLFLFFCTSRHSFSFFLASPSSSSLWLSLVLAASFQKSLSFLSFSVGIFPLHWRPLSFFTASPPPLSFSPWLCLSLLCAVFYPCVTKS